MTSEDNIIRLGQTVIFDAGEKQSFIAIRNNRSGLAYRLHEPDYIWKIYSRIKIADDRRPPPPAVALPDVHASCTRAAK